MMHAVRTRLARHRHNVFAQRLESQVHETGSEELRSDLQPLKTAEGLESPSTRHLYIKVSHAEGLLAMDSNGKSDPFCVLILGSRRHKTSTKMKTLEPVWNETFSFRSKDVARANGVLLFELFDKDQWTSDDFLGRAEVNVHETLKEMDQKETLDLQLKGAKWKMMPSLLSSRQGKSGQMRVELWWGQEDRSAEVTCDGIYSDSPSGSESAHHGEMRVKKTDVCPSEIHPRSLPLIVHSSRGSVFEEPIAAVLLLKISQVELNLDPCMPLDEHCSTKCIIRSTGRAARRRVSRVLGNLIHSHPVTTLRGQAFLSRPSAALSDTSSALTTSSVAHTNEFFNRLVFNDSDSDEDDDDSNGNESSDDSVSMMSDLDVKEETQWFYEVKLFDQTRCSESVGYRVNSGLKTDFADPVVFVVQLPLPNVNVTITMCKKSKQKGRIFRVPFNVSLFDIMDAEDGADATASHGSMTIHYTLIPLDDRPRLMNIQHKLDVDDQRPLGHRQSIPEGSEPEDGQSEESDLSGTVPKRIPSGEELTENEKDGEVMVGQLHAFLDEIELPQLKSNVHSCFCVLKCQHHWVMTSSQMADCFLSWKWLLKLPVYDPATVISLSAFGGIGRLGQSARLGKLRVRLSTLQPGVMYDSRLPFFSDGVEIGCAKISLRVSYPSETNLMREYIKCRYQKEIYDYGLAYGAAKSIIRKEHRKLIIQWLDTSEPRISKAVSRHVLDLEKESFHRKRFTMHIRRIQHCFAFMAPASQKIASLQSWENRCESTAVIIGIWIAGWHLTAALVVGLLVMFWLVSLQFRVPTTPLSMADPILMPAVPSESTSPKPERSTEHSNPYTLLKARYDQIQSTLVKVQQVLDSIATFCERVQALFTWKDPVATKLLTMGLLLAVLAVSVLGLRFCVCFGLCWFFRPPILRTALPPPPLNFFRRLPSRSDQIL